MLVCGELMKRCIVNVSVRGDYPKAQKKLKLDAEKFGIDFVGWADSYPPFCPTYEESMYVFKPHAFLSAWMMGYDQVLWCDSWVSIVRPIDRVWDLIDTHGYYFMQDGNNFGEYCSDTVLDKVGIGREESFTIIPSDKSIRTTIVGLDLRDIRAREFLWRWYNLANDGIFTGSRSNEKNQISSHPRVKGHRHDQTAAQIAIYQMGLDPTITFRPWFAYYDLPNNVDNDDILFLHWRGRRPNKIIDCLEELLQWENS